MAKMTGEDEEATRHRGIKATREGGLRVVGCERKVVLGSLGRQEERIGRWKEITGVKEAVGLSDTCLVRGWY